MTPTVKHMARKRPGESPVRRLPSSTGATASCGAISRLRPAQSWWPETAQGQDDKLFERPTAPPFTSLRRRAQAIAFTSLPHAEDPPLAGVVSRRHLAAALGGIWRGGEPGRVLGGAAAGLAARARAGRPPVM